MKSPLVGPINMLYTLKFPILNIDICQLATHTDHNNHYSVGRFVFAFVFKETCNSDSCADYKCTRHTIRYSVPYCSYFIVGDEVFTNRSNDWNLRSSIFRVISAAETQVECGSCSISPVKMKFGKNDRCPVFLLSYVRFHSCGRREDDYADVT